MANSTLVTFYLSEDRKEVWENEAEDRGRSLSGFIRRCGEKEIADNDQTQSGGVDHTEELSELHTILRGLVSKADAIDESIDMIHREVSIPEESKNNIPEVVEILPNEEEGGMTIEEIREYVSMTELSIIQCLNHTEEQTNIVGHDMVEQEGIRRYYRRV